MPKIFLSYRRGDSADVTGRIDDRLLAEFGRENVFKDVDSIPLGRDFRTHLGEAVGGCDVLLVVMGDGWLKAKDADGNSRLEDPSDFVRIEVESALKRDIPVVPVLLGRAEMPRADQLPEALSELAFRNGTRVRPDPDFHLDMNRIMAAIKQIGPPPSATTTETPAPPPRITGACECGRILTGAAKMAGKQARCPACQAVVRFPGGADASDAAEAAPLHPPTRVEPADRTRPRGGTPEPRRRGRSVAILVSLLILGGAGVLAWMNRGALLETLTDTADGRSADGPIPPVPTSTAQARVHLAVTSPPSDALLSSRTIQVQGTVSGPLPEGSLRIGRATARVARDGVFEATLEAPDDGPFSFQVRCTDASVLSEPVARRVVVDSEPPRLELTLPEAGVETVSTPELLVTGRLVDDHPEELRVNGDAVALDEEGRFERSWQLTPDRPLTLVFEARDKAGHRMPRLERTFRYEPSTDEAEAELHWVTDVAAAKEQAAKESKDLFINFSGSDWCESCQKLDDEVFNHPAFVHEATKSYVFVLLDFPSDDALEAEVVDPELNERLRGDYLIDAYPTIILATAGGKPYGRTGYVEGGPEAYLEHLLEMEADGEAVKKLLADATHEDLETLEAAFPVLAENSFLAYPDYAWTLEAVEKLDPKGELELLHYVEEERTRRLAAAEEIELQGLFPTSSEDEPDRDAILEFLLASEHLHGSRFLDRCFGLADWLLGQARPEEARALLARAAKDPLVEQHAEAKEAFEKLTARADAMIAEAAKLREVVVRLEAPAEGALLALDVVEVRGRVEGGAGQLTVLVNDEEVTTRRDGTFTHALRPSGDGVFEIVAVVDDTGHRSATVSRTVEIDRSPPRLDVTSPRTTTATARSHVVLLSGRVTDPHLEGLYLNGEPVVVAADGSFRWPVFAPSGNGASLSLEASDTLGNRTSRAYRVIGRANQASRAVMPFHDTWSAARAAAQRSQKLVFACVSRYNPP